jgi:hypothetical protein
MRRVTLSLLLAVVLPLVAAQAKAPPVSDVLKAKRPADGEWFGLYLLDKKVGHVFTHLQVLPGEPDKVQSVNEFVFKANVGNRVSERVHREVRVYEARPEGRLLTLRVEQRGDGGDQTIVGTNTPEALHIVRKRPGQPNDVRTLPPSAEKVESADQARVALVRGAKVEGVITDGMDLESYKVTSTPEKSEDRMVAGVKVRLHKVTTISEKEKVPALAAFTAAGETVEIIMGETLRARAEPEETAKRLDRVEVFGLTRIVLPRVLPDSARKIPGAITLVVEGLPERFHKDTGRQTHKKLPRGRTEVTIRAAYPSKENRASRPLADPAGGEYLKSTLAVESDHPEIQKLARKLVGDEKNAWEAAKKINAWVYANMERDYGASADRASDVLRQMKGDCTEHSLLAVALMRAVGIPAKRVDGVVYLRNEDRVPALYWHEWVGAYVGEWVDLDPTFNQTIADATHLALGEEGGAEITPLIGSLKVVEVR